MIEISLGHGAYFYISEHREMGICQQQNGKITANILLGAATERNLERLLSTIASLRIHTTRG